jgi:uncharacterized protein
MKTEIQGKPVVCAHCGGERFTQRKVKLNTALLTFFNLNWLNASADVFVCEVCGHLEWFLDPSTTSEEDAATDNASESAECISCGEVIPAGEEKCPKCGWTYR